MKSKYIFKVTRRKNQGKVRNTPIFIPFIDIIVERILRTSPSFEVISI